MIGLLQRVLHSSVHVEQQEIAHIEQGLLVLIGVEKNIIPSSLQYSFNFCQNSSGVASSFLFIQL